MVNVSGLCCGVLGIPLLENEKSLGFLVSWCLGFKDSCFLGFLVSWFESFLVSWFQSFKELPNVHFMFSGRYWSHIQDFQDFIWRIVGICWCPPFRKIKMLDLQHFEIYKNSMLKQLWEFLRFIEVSWCLQRWNSWFWEPGTRPEIPTT